MLLNLNFYSVIRSAIGISLIIIFKGGITGGSLKHARIIYPPSLAQMKKPTLFQFYKSNYNPKKSSNNCDMLF